MHHIRVLGQTCLPVVFFQDHQHCLQFRHCLQFHKEYLEFCRRFLQLPLQPNLLNHPAQHLFELNKPDLLIRNHFLRDFPVPAYPLLNPLNPAVHKCRCMNQAVF